MITIAQECKRGKNHRTIKGLFRQTQESHGVSIEKDEVRRAERYDDDCDLTIDLTLSIWSTPQRANSLSLIEPLISSMPFTLTGSYIAPPSCNTSYLENEWMKVRFNYLGLAALEGPEIKLQSSSEILGCLVISERAMLSIGNFLL